MANHATAKAAQSVLVVDDDDAIRLFIARVLARAGYDVVEAHDGSVAIEKLESDRFDAVVLDLMMPRVNGAEVLAYMKERMYAHKCVVIASAATEHALGDVDSTFVAATLRKPFDLDALLAALNGCTDMKRTGLVEGES